jgi:hypothetical protein
MEFGLKINLFVSYNSQVQVPVTVSRMYALYKSLYCSVHKVFYFFTSRYLVKALNNVDSSAPVFMSLPAGDSLSIPHGRNSYP